LAALLIVLVTTSIHHNTQEQQISELIDLHVATTASANPVDVVSSDRHTVKPWFQGKLPFTFNLPEFQGTPFTLVGGRLVYFHDTPAAELLFQLHKHQISAFILQEPSHPLLPESVADLTRRGFSLESWNHSGMRYVLVGDASPADLRALGSLLRAAQ
jgi:anti-sigma factor RsiW